MSNAYESAQQKVIPAVLLYAFHQDRVLMIHRNLNRNDFHEGKWNGLGGKSERLETPVDTAVREFEEEAFCKTKSDQWLWLGHLSFPNFKAAKNEDWSVTVFAIDLNDDQAQAIPDKNLEGTLHWISKNEVLNLNLWDGDRHFIPHVLAKRPFQGSSHYENGSCVRHNIQPISANSLSQ